MHPLRIAVSGLGTMGLQYARALQQGAIAGATLGALCNRNGPSLARATAEFPTVPAFDSLDALLAARACDALLIATPHPDHPPACRAALAAGVHVLVEKPLAVAIAPARNLVRFSEQFPTLQFGIMYNQRTNPLYAHLRQLIADGELGHLSRITWIITNWFRTDAYYRSSPWRATWQTEGGGVLINQCPHNLDLLCWITGLFPSRITAVAFTGKHHPIEVEDDVTAILEYPAPPGQPAPLGQIITTTGEFPGINRLEIAGTRASVVAENNTLTLTRLQTDARDFSRTSPELFGKPAATTTTIPFPPPPPQPAEHLQILQDFVDAVRHNRPRGALLAPAANGLHALELANAMLLAGLTRTPVELPLDGAAYDAFLSRLISLAPAARQVPPTS